MSNAEQKVKIRCKGIEPLAKPANIQWKGFMLPLHQQRA